MAYDDSDYEPDVTNPHRRWPLVLAALVLVGAAGAGTAYVVASDDDDKKVSAAASPSPSPSASPSSESPTPAAEPGLTESPAAAPEPVELPTASTGPTPARAPSRSASPTPRSSPTRSTGSGYPPKGLTIVVVGEPITGDPPAVRFRIRVRDNDGSEVNGTINFGDGTSQVYSRRAPGACRTTPSSPPPGYRAQPIDKSFTLTHPYERSGTFTVVVTANTERQCEGTPAETATQRLIVVIPERPTQSPTPAAPAPSPSASPSPTRSP